MFSSKEAGDYFNNNLILLKYDLDIADPDGIMEKYAIRAFPTFVFIDGNGAEYSRFVGGGDTQSFIQKTKNALLPQSSWTFKEEQLKTDPSFLIEYIDYLLSIYAIDKADVILNQFFETRSIRENFSKEYISLYNTMIRDINAPIFRFMLSNQKEVTEVVGEEQYKSSLISMVNNSLITIFANLNFDKPESLEKLENDLNTMNLNPLLRSNVSLFLTNNYDHIKDRNIKVFFEHTEESIPKVNTNDRYLIINLYHYVSNALNGNPQYVATLYERAIESEEDPNTLENYKKILEKLKK